MLYFWNPDDSLIPNMTLDTWPWSPCSSNTISSSTGPSVSPFQDFFYSQWIKWCQLLCLILPFLITLSKTCWHSLAWLRTNSAIQPDFRLHSDQTRSLCSSNSPEKNVHLKVQYQKTYFQQHSLSTFFFREEKVGDKGAVWRGYVIAGQVIIV